MTATENGIDVTKHLGLVRTFARKYASRGVEYDDLFGAGCVGLCKAAAAFDATRGFAFSTYAVPVIVGEMKRLFRDDGTVSVSRRIRELSKAAEAEAEFLRTSLGREPRLSELSARLGESEENLALALLSSAPPLSLSYETDAEEPPLEIPVESGEEALLLRLTLNDALNRLPEADRTLLTLRYRFGFSQQKTAERLSLTQVQVSRRERKLLLQLRRELQ